jgi:membrane protease YdiL (CAAX protease family)
MQEALLHKRKLNLELITFLVLTLGFSSIIWFKWISAKEISQLQGLIYVIAIMWSPGLAALITRFIYHRNLKGLGWRWGKTKYQVLSFVLPVLYALPVYLVVIIFSLGALNTEFSPNWVSLLTINLFLGLFTALGEEIGWRGFLTSHLFHRIGFTGASLVTGLIWAVWHYPLIIFSNYNQGAPVVYSLVCFTLMAVGISFPMAWFKIKTGSVWTAMFIHAMHNFFIQDVFDPLTVNTGITHYIIGEFGAGLAITGLICAFIFWKLRSRLS